MKLNRKSGFSLVEVMVSIIILLVLALGGAAILAQTGGTIQRQQNKREATVAANTALEQSSSKSFEKLLEDAGSTQAEAVIVNDIDMELTIDTGQKITDVDGRDYVEVSARVSYLGVDDDVFITTRRYEYGLSKAVLEIP